MCFMHRMFYFEWYCTVGYPYSTCMRSEQKCLTASCSIYSIFSNKRRVANKCRVWNKYQNPINVGSGTNAWPGIFVRFNKETVKNCQFFRFSPKFSMIFSKIHKRRV